MGQGWWYRGQAVKPGLDYPKTISCSQFSIPSSLRLWGQPQPSPYCCLGRFLYLQHLAPGGNRDAIVELDHGDILAVIRVRKVGNRSSARGEGDRCKPGVIQAILTAVALVAIL